MMSDPESHTSAASVENLVRRIIGSMQQSEDELNRRFNIPRGPVGQSQSSSTGAPPTSVPSGSLSAPVCTETSGTSQTHVLARQYEPQRNYGYTNYNRRTPRTVRSSTPYVRTPRSQSSAKQVSKRVEPPSSKEVMLLPKPGYNEVPKYQKKADLHKQGLILDSVGIERFWTENELRNKMQMIFEDKLRNNCGSVGYVFIIMIVNSCIVYKFIMAFNRRA